MRDVLPWFAIGLASLAWAALPFVYRVSVRNIRRANEVIERAEELLSDEHARVLVDRVLP